MANQVELPQGTLEMLILKAVSLGPLHGYGVLLRIQQISSSGSKFCRAPSIPPSIVWSTAAGSKANGVSRRTIAAPASTRSPRRCAPAQNRNRQMDRHGRRRRRHSRQEGRRDMNVLATIRKLWRSIAPRSHSDVEEEFRSTSKPTGRSHPPGPHRRRSPPQSPHRPRPARHAERNLPRRHRPAPLR